MANEIDIQVHAVQDASAELDDIGNSARDMSRTVQAQMANTEQAFDTAARSTGRLGDALDKAAGFGQNMSDGLSGVSDVTSSVSDIMSYGETRAREYAQAQQDVEQATSDAAQAEADLRQATRDAAQAQIDGKQAALDVEQARLDQTEAQKELNKAIKEHGRNSAEAKQAEIDLKQAGIDLTQANEDAKQALEDGKQAQLDANQAKLDGKQANLDLASSQAELATQSSALTKVSDWTGMLSGVLSGLVGIIGAVTAVQWAWNASLLANPITWVVIAIVALVAIIIVIATKTDWFSRLWNAIWSKIGDPVKAVLDFIVNYYQFVFAVFKKAIEIWWKVFTTAWKTAIDLAVRYFKFVLDLPGKLGSVFSRVGNAIYAPFKYAFNRISWAWNNTVGRLHWSIPGWVPGIGGNSISAPRLPQLQRGGDILRTGVALVHQGERIVPAHTRGLSNDSGGAMAIEVYARRGGSRDLLDLLIELLAFKVRTTGGGRPEYLGIDKAVTA